MCYWSPLHFCFAESLEWQKSCEIVPSVVCTAKNPRAIIWDKPWNRLLCDWMGHWIVAFQNNLQADQDLICLVPPADSSEDVQQLCPDCPLLESLNNTEVLATVTAALSSHNSRTTGAHLRLLEIGRATIQVIARTMSSLPCKQANSSVVIVRCQLLCLQTDLACSNLFYWIPLDFPSILCYFSHRIPFDLSGRCRARSHNICLLSFLSSSAVSQCTVT